MLYVYKIITWFGQLGGRLSTGLILCLIFTPLFTYLHFNIPDPEEAVTLLQYLYGFLYRGGFLCLFIYFADACRFIFQKK